MHAIVYPCTPFLYPLTNPGYSSSRTSICIPRTFIPRTPYIHLLLIPVVDIDKLFLAVSQAEGLLTSFHGLTKVLDPGYVTKVLDPGYVTKVLDPGYVTKVLDPGYATKVLDPGYVTKVLDPGYVTKVLDPGYVTKVLDPVRN